MHNYDFDRIIARSIYPGLMVCVVAAHLLLSSSDSGLLASTYLPVACGALAIIALERWFPYRREWLPRASDVFNDGTFMLLVQILLPRFLSLLVGISVLRLVQSSAMNLPALWPNHLPIVAQALLMMVGAEFLRYWVHRLMHNWSPLWRLHAVHHSPHKLYWLNVCRFHPLEKALQFLFDTLPFMLLGVGEEVLALYFVFYSINGFFQHCNIRVEMGFLNYIISGPQLHRWHHSRLVKESNNNYGNNLIIWDLVFGSWYLPIDREVDELGLHNRQYPTDFVAQLRTPFVKGLDKAAS